MDLGDPQKGDGTNEKTYSNHDRGPAPGGSRRGRSRPLECLVGSKLRRGPSTRRDLDGDGHAHQPSARPRSDLQVADELHARRRDDRDEQYRRTTRRSAALGQWERIGNDLFATSMWFFRSDPATGEYVGTQEIDRTMRLSADGESFTAVAVVHVIRCRRQSRRSPIARDGSRHAACHQPQPGSAVSVRNPQDRRKLNAQVRTIMASVRRFSPSHSHSSPEAPLLGLPGTNPPTSAARP